MTSNPVKPVFALHPGEGEMFNILGQPTRVLLRSGQSEAGCYCFEQITPPGFGVPTHTHQFEDEFVHVLEGQFEIILGDNLFVARPGSVFNFARGTKHGYRSIGPENGKTFWVVSPGKNFEAFFDELKLFPSGPPDEAKISALARKYGAGF
jgi:mannose-6-phosphate isomerase-like protein (cupin superfamily)